MDEGLDGLVTWNVHTPDICDLPENLEDDRLALAVLFGNPLLANAFFLEVHDDGVCILEMGFGARTELVSFEVQ